MSRLTEARRLHVFQPRAQIRAIALAADQAAELGDRETCIDHVTRIFHLLDSACEAAASFDNGKSLRQSARGSQ